LWDQGWRGTGPKMGRIRTIPDTWTLEIHAIVLKDSRQSRTRGNWLHEHDKMKLSVLEHQTWWERSSKERNARNKKDTTRRSSAYSNTKRGGRGAQKKETLETKKRTPQDEAQYTRTPNVVEEELKKRKKGDIQRKGRSNVWTMMAKRRVLMDLFWDQKGIDIPTEGWWRNSFDKNYRMQEHHTTCKATVRFQDAILLIRIIRCRSIIRHARRPYDYDAILLISIIRCRSIIRHARRPYD